MTQHYLNRSVLSDQKEEVYSYLAPLQFDDVVRIGKLLRDDLPCDNRQRKKIFQVGVELLENLYRHTAVSVDEQSELYSQGFIVGQAQDRWFIATGNLIASPQVNAVKEHLEKINACDGDALRQQYMDRMSAAQFSEKGGAGLGLMDIRIKASDALEFQFLPVNDETQYFVICVYLD